MANRITEDNIGVPADPNAQVPQAPVNQAGVEVQPGVELATPPQAPVAPTPEEQPPAPEQPPVQAQPVAAAPAEVPQPAPDVAPPAPAQAGADATVDEKLALIDAKMAELKKMQEDLSAQQGEASKFFENKATQQDVTRHIDKAANTKKRLEAQPKVSIFVPLQGSEKKGTQLPVTINGYRVNVPKGIYVDVPKQVAEIIMESLNQTAAAEQDNPFNLNNAPENRRQALEG